MFTLTKGSTLHIYGTLSAIGDINTAEAITMIYDGGTLEFPPVPVPPICTLTYPSEDPTIMYWYKDGCVVPSPQTPYGTFTCDMEQLTGGLYKDGTTSTDRFLRSGTEPNYLYTRGKLFIGPNIIDLSTPITNTNNDKSRCIVYTNDWNDCMAVVISKFTSFSSPSIQYEYYMRDSTRPCRHKRYVVISGQERYFFGKQDETNTRAPQA
jgi:hypothetical protein